MKPLRLCALCKHFQVVETGREFEGIADTAYLVFRCNQLGVTGREDYLMEPSSSDISAAQREFDCPHWEAWNEKLTRA